MTDQSASTFNDEGEREQLGERLREARKYLGLKQEDVAVYTENPTHGVS